MPPELMTFIITSVISAVIGAFLGRYGVMRNVTALVDSGVQKVNTEAQIALARAEADLQAEKAQYSHNESLTELLRTQLLQNAQTTAAWNSLETAIRESTSSMQLNQRMAGLNVETVLAAYDKNVQRLDIQLRSVADTSLRMDGLYDQTTTKINSTMDTLRDMVNRIQDDIRSLRMDSERDRDYLDDVIELITYMRNSVTILAQGEAAESLLIRAADDYRPLRTPPPAQPLPDIPDKSLDNQPALSDTNTPINSVNTTSAANVAAEETKP